MTLLKKLKIQSIYIIICFLSIFIIASLACAKSYPSLYRGIRPLGMGGAFTAVADDENALFYNPAGLSNIDKFSIGLINPLIEVSEKSIDLINDVQDTDMDDTGETSDLLREYVGEPQHIRVGLFPYVGFNIANAGVMIGGMAQETIDAEIRNPPWPEAHINFVKDIGLFGGAGLKLPFQGVRIGATVKMIDRESLEEMYTAADIADDDFEDMLEDDLNSGSGFSADIGAIYTLPFKSIVKTDIGLTIQNIPEMDMGKAADVKTQANLGVAVQKSFAKFTLIGALDYKDISHNIGEDDDHYKRIHMGTELQFPVVFAIRAGLNQGYYSAGASIDLWFFKLDVATYGEEVGAHAGQKEDRRYVGQFTFGW